MMEEAGGGVLFRVDILVLVCMCEFRLWNFIDMGIIGVRVKW
jgi:hypothetical protein